MPHGDYKYTTPRVLHVVHNGNRSFLLDRNAFLPIVMSLMDTLKLTATTGRHKKTNIKKMKLILLSADGCAGVIFVVQSKIAKWFDNL